MSIKNDFSFFLVKKLNKKEKKIEQKVKKKLVLQDLNSRPAHD
jgi:hypothetical protein